MHVFDLFEGHEERKDAPVKPTAAQADSKDQRAVSGVRGDIYNKTNIAGVRRAIDNAIQSEPGAKSEIEAIVSYLDKQAQKNAEQEREIEKLEREEDRLRQAQDSLVKDLSDKENRFRELTAQVASGKIDQVQAARMAQDIEAGRQPQVPTTQATAQPTAAQAAPATPVARPGLPVGVSGTQTPAQPKPQAQAQTKPAAQEPTTSRALGQMAQQLAPQGRVIRGKKSSTPTPDQAQSDQAQLFDLPAGVIDLAKVKKDKEAASAGAFGALDIDNKKVANLKEQAEDPAITLAKKNIQVVKNAYLAGRPEKVRIYNTQGLPMDLTQPVLHALVDALGTIPEGENKKTLLINLFTNNSFLMTWLMDNVLSKYVKTDSDPEQQPANAGPEQLPILEGDVVPMTKDEITVQAYNDALKFLKYAYQRTADNNIVRAMRQDFASKYQQRFAILPNADGKTYSMVDKQQSKRYNLPLPGFPLEEGAMKAVAMSGQGVPEKYTVVKMVGGDIVPIKAHDSQSQAQLHAKNIKKKYPGMQIAVADESGQLSMIGLSEEPHDGKSAWSDGQGQWSSENNLISSGNNPHGFSEAETPRDNTGAKMYQAQEKILVRHNGRDVAFFPDIETAKAYAQDMQRELKGYATIHRVMREATGDAKFDAMMDRIVKIDPYVRQAVYSQASILCDFYRCEPEQLTPKMLKRIADATGVDVGTVAFMLGIKLPQGVAEGFEYGNRVQHPKYGAGQVVKVYPNGTIEVNFPNYPDPVDKKPGVRSNFAPGDKDYQSLRSVAEAQTDYQKRRQRERDVDMGKPVVKPREPKQTDYQKKRAQDRKDMELGEENKGLYYNVNKRKKAGTSRPAGHPKAPTAQAWKDAAKTAKKESVQESYWQRLQRERAEKQHAKAWSLLEQELKDL